MTTTTNLSDFGSRERNLLVLLLQAWDQQGLPKDFSDDAVVPMMNMNSGNVFLTNSDFEVAMMNGESLEMFHTLPYGGEEGFLDDLLMLDAESLNQDDIDYIRELDSDYQGWSAGWNMPGYMPEMEPAVFNSFDEAKRYIIGEMKQAEESIETEEDAESLCHAAEDVNLQSDEFTTGTLSGYVYWVSKV